MHQQSRQTTRLTTKQENVIKQTHDWNRCS